MRLSHVVIAALAMLAISGCNADPVSVAKDSYRGLPGGPSSQPLVDSEISAEWIEKGSTFAIITWGSSSCPPVPVSLEGSKHVVVIKFDDSRPEICTADMAPTTRVFDLPSGTATHGVTVKLLELYEPVQLELP